MRSERGSSLIAVLVVAVLMLLIIGALLPSAQNSEMSGLSSVLQADLGMAAESTLTIQSAQVVTNNDHRASTIELDATPPSVVSDAERLPQRQRLSAAVVSVVFDSPCNLCGVNNEMIYANNVPARNVVYQLEACASRHTAVGKQSELGRHCRSSQLNLFPWSNDGGARALAEDKIEFPLP